MLQGTLDTDLGTFIYYFQGLVSEEEEKWLTIRELILFSLSGTAAPYKK